MFESIECSGHPRDMGLQQGSACREGVVEWLRQAGLPLRRGWLTSLAPYASGGIRGRGAGREVIRHFTHLSERIDGMAREARVPADSLLALHLRTSQAGGAALLAGGAVGAVASAAGEGSTAALVRSAGTIALPSSRAGWVVRQSRPEVGFRSLEVTLPWLASAIAGINAEGLAALYLPRHETGEEPADDAGRAAAPPVLLVQECLQRFEGLEASLDWCLERPTHGTGELIVADRSGASAIVVFSGGDRSTRVTEAGHWSDGSGSPEVRSEPALRELAGLDPLALSKWAAGSGAIAEPAGWIGLRADDGVVEFVTRAGDARRWSIDDD